MAYDKVVDSGVLNANLTSIANAIREKAGGSASLAFPAGFVEAVAGISSGGGTILGHNFAAGSFTLAEDVTASTYIILTESELFEAVKDDFPNAASMTTKFYLKNNSTTTPLHNFLAAVCWQDNTDAYNHDYEKKEILAIYKPKTSLSSSSMALACTDNYGNFTVTNLALSEFNFGYIINSGLCIKTPSSYTMYAGNKYNWIVFPIDHGEVSPW